MALYETVFITRQDMTTEDVDNLSTKLEKIITDGKGKLVSKEYWGLRKLAFRINKNDRGHYVLFNIQADYPVIAELNRVMGFNEDIIRNITLNNEFEVVESDFFLCKNAKDFKPGKVAPKKEAVSKYDSILDQMQFDN